MHSSLGRTKHKYQSNWHYQWSDTIIQSSMWLMECTGACGLPISPIPPLLYYCVRSLTMPVGLISVLISPLLELCTAATAAHHWLAYGRANAHNTKVGQLLCFLSDGSNCPKIQQSSNHSWFSDMCLKICCGARKACALIPSYSLLKLTPGFHGINF